MKFWFQSSHQAKGEGQEHSTTGEIPDSAIFNDIHGNNYDKGKVLYVDFRAQNSSKSVHRPPISKDSAEVFYPAFLSSARYIEGLEKGHEITQLQLHGLIAYTTDIRRAYRDENFQEIPRFAARLTAVAKDAQLPIVEIMAIDIGQNAIDENIYKLNGKITVLEGLIETILAGLYQEYGLSKH